MKLTLTEEEKNTCSSIFDKTSSKYDIEDMERDFDIDGVKEQLMNNDLYGAYMILSPFLTFGDCGTFMQLLLSTTTVEDFIKQSLEWERKNAVVDYLFEEVNLESGAVIIPDGIEAIGYKAFYNNLSAIFIPKSVTIIENIAFNLILSPKIYFEETSNEKIKEMLTNSNYIDLLKYEDKFSCSKEEFIERYADKIV